MSHTVSPEQLAANRANAAKSTGPTTPAGKLRSPQNARKHGFTATSFAVGGFRPPHSQRFGLVVNPRSIERRLPRGQKKTR